MSNITSCKCTHCQGACAHKPGWFLPGEAEKVADHLGLSLEELFETRLMVDWLIADPDIFLLSPAIVESVPGREFPANPNGTCTFFKDGLCEIHPVRPMECALYRHDVSYEDSVDAHEDIALQWNTGESMDQIESLLGREPRSEAYGISAMLGVLCEFGEEL